MRIRVVPRSTSSVLAFTLIAVAATGARAQTVSIMAKAGGYLPVNEVYEIPGAIEQVTIDRQADLVFGGAVELSPMFWPVDLRFGGDYLTGVEITVQGTSGETFPAEGTLLMLSGDAVLRPFPRLIFAQPYLLVGIGYKRESFAAVDGSSSALPEDYDDYLFHAGLGADVELGGVALVAEVSDYFVGPGTVPGQGWFDSRHDLLASVGLEVGLF